jgi:Ohr subfamily peroxiredoxin
MPMRRARKPSEGSHVPTLLDKITYTAQVSVTGGRAEGHAVSSDGILDLQLRRPVEMGGPGAATNPEQLFAAGYAACFQGALGVVAARSRVDVSTSTVTCKVSFGPTGRAFGLAAELEVRIPGVDAATGQKLVDGAHEVCPYSNATRGNIEVTVRFASQSVRA